MKRLVGAWFLLLLVGLGGLALHSSQPGEAADAPATWPPTTPLPLSSQVPTLLVFIHPECPCSQATLTELARLRVRCPAMQVIGVAGPGREVSWPEGVTVVKDERLVETARFGAFTSGQALLYGTDGKLRFAGGLTGSRGHEGDNDGADAAARAVRGGSGLSGAAVYGCGLGTDEFCRSR